VYAPDAPMFDIVDPKVFSLKKKNKGELIEELRLRNMNTEGKYKDLRDRAAAAGIDIMKMVYKTILGYGGSAKGLKQVAWERGYVTRQMLQDDVVTLDGYWRDQDGNKCRKDKDGAYFDENTSLRFIIGKCKDFQEEITRLEYFAQKLGCKVIFSLNAHPELSGRGIEYSWGDSKLTFRKKCAGMQRKESRDLNLNC